MTKTHWKKVDYRLESLIYTINGLENAITELKKKLITIDYYDSGWYQEEVEPIIGLAFVSLQNYINSSIYDRFASLDKQYEKYKLGNLINNSGRTDIDLIIGLANYFKHRDDHRDLHISTQRILTDFSLNHSKENNIDNSPLLIGLEYLSKDEDLISLIQLVKKWREKIWLVE